MIEIVTDGHPRARIVVLESASPVESHAAAELNRYLYQMSRTHLPVETVSSLEQTNIYIGSAAPVTELDLSEEALGFDGYVVKTVGTDIALVGIKPYSCLYAVYHLLTRHLGCGFFEDGDQVPSQPSVTVGRLNDVCKPKFEWRNKCVAHFPAYSGHRWYSEEEWKQWFDWLVKTRINTCEVGWLARYTGIEALAAARFGIQIELTPWQEQNLAMMRRLFDYARMCGIRCWHEVTWHMPWLANEPGSMPYYDSVQTTEFWRKYQESTGKIVPTVPYDWCGLTFQWLDPRIPEVQEFITACVATQMEVLGSDHYYYIGIGGEGHFGSGSPEELDELTEALLFRTIDAVKAADPQAVILTGQPFAYASTYQAQKRAVKKSEAIVVTNFLAVPQRIPDFQLNDYYWGLRWTNGMVVQCGKHTNPWGDMKVAVENAKALCRDPRAYNWWGFAVGGESSHRAHIKQDLLTEIAWDPMSVDLDDFVRRWTSARYGAAAAERLQPVTQAAMDTLYACYNMDMTNRPLYRDWAGGYLPGLTPTSIKRTLSYLPKLRFILETMLEEFDSLQKLHSGAVCPLYHFDVVDYGRVYLGALFNDRLARVRKAFRAGNQNAFERHAAEVEEVMHFIAKLTSSHNQFQLKVHDDRAAKCPQILPGHANQESNWVTFTATQSPTAWRPLLDYTAEDYAELVEHYFWPRVEQYLNRMREMLEGGEDISSQMGRDFVISDWASPKGPLPWSPYGIVCEPELSVGDKELAHRIIAAGSKSGEYDFYQGPLKLLIEELLARFPVPEDLDDVLNEEDPTQKAYQIQSVSGQPGDVNQGFHTPEVVELVVVPETLGYVVEVEQLDSVYNVARGEVTRCKVHVSDWLDLTRLPDQKSERGDHAIVVYEFSYDEKCWLLRYDPGSDQTFASLRIDPYQDQS